MMDADTTPVSRSLVSVLRRHPDFPSAMRRSANAAVAAHDHNRLLNRVISDRGRAVFGILALSLHFDPKEPAGLTASRMAEVCAEVAVCSRGRVKAILVLLRWAGYLAAARGARDLRRRPLAPTERMIEAYRSRWRQQLLLMSALCPEAGPVAERLDRPETFARYAVALGRLLRSGFRILDHAPALLPLAERDNGLLLVLLLGLSGRDGWLVPGEPVSATVTDLAARARVSRSHAVNVFRDAERLGLIARGSPAEGSRIICRPLLAESLEGFFAATYAAMATAAKDTVQAMDRT